jgi:transcriptional regulator of NAD metabolism
MKLAEKGAERKKTKHHVPASKTKVVEKEIAEEMGDGGEEGEEVEKLEEVVENVVGQAQKVAVKNGNSGGAKKTKKSMGVEKEEEEFPTMVENLYSIKATTLIALVKLLAGQGGERSGVTTRSKE